VSGVVTAYAGPWRTSGDWIAQDSWEHDEWDVALQSGGVYRLRRLAMNQWLIDGNYD
jgi:protein ImuB